MKRLKLNPFLVVGLLIILTFILSALWGFTYSYDEANKVNLSQKFISPGFTHLMGTDETGASLFKKVLIGARISLFISFTVVFIGLILGTIFGAISGYYGGKLDEFMMRTLDLFYSFPGFLLALTLVCVLGPSLMNLIIALSLTSWTGFARLVRGEVLYLKELDYVSSAKSIGSSDFRVLLFYILPNLTGVLLVQATFSLAGTLIVESGLSFLGLGAPAHIPTWGALLNSGKFYLVEAFHISFFPGICIVLLVLGFNLLGDGLKQSLDPKKNSVV
jgi:peptide/nickel transport system permease protein